MEIRGPGGQAQKVVTLVTSKGRRRRKGPLIVTTEASEAALPKEPTPDRLRAGRGARRQAGLAFAGHPTA